MRLFTSFIKLFITAIIIQLVCYTAQSQEISKVSDIYDFEIGDVFHIHYWGTLGNSGFSEVCNFEILNKYYSLTGDTLYYSEDVACVWSDEMGTQYYNYIDTLSYTNLDAEINDGNIDTVYSDPDLYNGRMINYFETYNSYWDYEERKYIVGCGQPFNYYYVHNPLEWLDGGKDLYYFHKGDEEWGEPFYVKIPENEYKQPQTLVVYPNPTKDYINIAIIDIPKSAFEVYIYSILGNVIKISNGQSDQVSQVDVSNIAKGIYILKVKLRNHELIGKFIKE